MSPAAGSLARQADGWQTVGWVVLGSAPRDVREGLFAFFRVVCFRLRGDSRAARRTSATSASSTPTARITALASATRRCRAGTARCSTAGRTAARTGTPATSSTPRSRGVPYNDRQPSRTATASAWRTAARTATAAYGYSCADPRQHPWNAILLDDNQDQTVCVPATSTLRSSSTVPDAKRSRRADLRPERDYDAQFPSEDAGAAGRRSGRRGGRWLRRGRLGRRRARRDAGRDARCRDRRDASRRRRRRVRRDDRLRAREGGRRDRRADRRGARGRLAPRVARLLRAAPAPGRPRGARPRRRGERRRARARARRAAPRSAAPVAVRALPRAASRRSISASRSGDRG